MRHFFAPAAAALIMCTASAPAFAKGHAQPSDTAQMLGQANAAAVEVVDGTVMLTESGARNADARGLTGDPKGVDGQTYSDTRSEVGGSESGLKSGDMTLPN